MNMSRELQLQILTILLNAQDRCAPVELSIGHVSEDNQVCHGTILIKSAPPVIVEKLLAAGFSLKITPKGVFVSFF